jgi:hypothetical protein
MPSKNHSTPPIQGGAFILRGFATNFICMVAFFLQKLRNPVEISEDNRRAV